jgi:hydrogenase maturation protease
MDAISTSSHLPPASAVALREARAAAAGSPALLLACGNSLREDDGVGLRIAEAVEQLIPASRLRIVAAQQFTPEMAADLAATDLAIFVDACVADDPGAIRVQAVAASMDSPVTHHLDPSALLAMAGSLCGHMPAHAFALTVGAGRLGYGTEIAGPVRQAIPRACRLVGNLLAAFTPTRA